MEIPFCSRLQDMSDNMNQQPQPQMQQAQQVQSTSQQQNQNQDLSNCDLANLESLSCNDSDELLRQLTENTFELETFFSEFSTADIKVRKAWLCLCSVSINADISFQEENNNDVIDSTNQQDNYNCNDINVEANLAILQNRLLASASSKFGINLVRGECLILKALRKLKSEKSSRQPPVQARKLFELAKLSREEKKLRRRNTAEFIDTAKQLNRSTD